MAERAQLPKYHNIISTTNKFFFLAVKLVMGARCGAATAAALSLWALPMPTMALPAPAAAACSTLGLAHMGPCSVVSQAVVRERVCEHRSLIAGQPATCALHGHSAPKLHRLRGGGWDTRNR